MKRIYLLKKTAAILAALLAVLSLTAASAADPGFFGILAQSEDADGRLAVLDTAAEPVTASLTTEAGVPVEIGQAYWEGNRVFVSYKIGAITDLIELFEGAPEEGIEWDMAEEDWIMGEIPSAYPDTTKENDWLDGKGQRWLKAPFCGVMDGLDLEDGAYADIIAGNEMKLEDGSIIGWKECVVPEEEKENTLTFKLGVSAGVVVMFQDYSTFKENFGHGDRSELSFTLTRHDGFQYLGGTSGAASAELAIGKVDLKGTVRLVSAEQAASWIAWQDGEEGTGTDTVAGWNLYRNGELVSEDLYGAAEAVGTDEVVFDVLFPLTDDLTGLTLVPVYGEAGEKPEEAIPLEPVIR